MDAVVRQQRNWLLTACVRIILAGLAMGLALGAWQTAGAASSGATIVDQAGLLTAADRSHIDRAAAAAGVHLIVVTDSQSPGDGNAWMQHMIATYGDPDTIVLGIHANFVQPSQSLVAVWSGNALGLTDAQDQQQAAAFVSPGQPARLSDKIDAMIWRLKAESDAARRDASAAATAAQIGRGIRSITALMVILAWVFVLVRRKRQSKPLWLPTRVLGCFIFGLVTLLWLAIAWNTVSLYVKVDPALAHPYALGYTAGAVFVDLMVMLGAAGIARRFVRRRPNAAIGPAALPLTRP